MLVVNPVGNHKVFSKIAHRYFKIVNFSHLWHDMGFNLSLNTG